MSLSPRYKEIRIGSDIGERPPPLDITDVKYVNGRQKQFDNWSGNHTDITGIWKDHKETASFVSLFFEKYIDTFFEDQKPYAPVTSVLGA